MLGFGLGTRRSFLAATIAAAKYLLACSPIAGWTGAAGTGTRFARPPTDPVRTTAKPAMRLLVPPGQHFTDALLVGVWAGANNGGSLADNMGLEKVIVHYEGTRVEITKPSFQTFPDANGNAVSYFGWWISLRNDGRSGTANLYFEAVPKDPTMQRRVIGPYAFYPRATLYDADLTIVPSQPEIWGSRFQTLARAMEYVRTSARQNPRIRIMETGFYRSDTWAQGTDYTASGWINVEAGPGVTATIRGDTTYARSLRTKAGPMHYRGQGLVFDMAYITEIYISGTTNNWFDGVRFINSLGQFSTWFGRVRPVSWISRGTPWFTECSFQYQADAVRGAQLARGCLIAGGYNDQMSGCVCAIGNTVRDADSSGLRTEKPSFSVQYTGAGASATLQVSGKPGHTTRVFTVKVDGSSIGTFTAANTGTTGGFYWMSDVVNWLNTLPGIAATLLSNRWAAVYVNVAGGGETALAATDIKTSAKTFNARSFPHADLYASEKFFENIVIADNLAWNNDVQILFNGGSPKDCLIVNNGFTHTSSHLWQMNTPNSHVVIVHNSTDYELWLRSSKGYTMDGYCLYANNVVATLNTPSTNYGKRIRNNHCYTSTSQTASPGYSSGGTRASLFVDAANGDFTPAGLLTTSLKTPTLDYDRKRRKRQGSDAPGALRRPPT